jgi:hypothetical protein
MDTYERLRAALSASRQCAMVKGLAVLDRQRSGNSAGRAPNNAQKPDDA